jgi:hypothetical protein
MAVSAAVAPRLAPQRYLFSSVCGLSSLSFNCSLALPVMLVIHAVFMAVGIRGVLFHHRPLLIVSRNAVTY